ncbi:MAG: hypothetical protein ACP5KB_00050 [Thermoprotei archaeon]
MFVVLLGSPALTNRPRVITGVSRVVVESDLLKLGTHSSSRRLRENK